MESKRNVARALMQDFSPREINLLNALNKSHASQRALFFKVGFAYGVLFGGVSALVFMCTIYLVFF